MKRLILPSLVALAIMAALPHAILAQVKKYDKKLDLEQIEKAYEKQKENEKAHAVKINHALGLRPASGNDSQDQSRDREAAAARQAAASARLEGERNAAETLIKLKNTSDPEKRKELGKSLAGQMTGVVRTNQVEETIEGGIVPSTATTRGTTSIDTSTGTAITPEEAASKLNVDKVQDNLDKNKAYQEAVQVNKAVQAVKEMKKEDFATQTGPGLPPGTEAERLLQQLNQVWDHADEHRDAVNGGETTYYGPPPAEVARLLRWSADLSSRINDHNGRMPNPPNPITDENDYRYWKGVVDTYNDEANRLNGELANLRSELDALDN